MNEEIEKLFNDISDSIFMIEQPLQYSEIHQAFIDLSNMIMEAETDETLWNMGECGHCDLGSLLVGAYWHYTEWHGGQYHITYETLCAIGQIFNPGMTNGPEPESTEQDVYSLLNEMVEKERDELTEEMSV